MSIFSSLMSWSKGKAKKGTSESSPSSTRLKPPLRNGAHEIEPLPVWRPGDVILDRYEVEKVITTGAMGRIYVTRHRDWNVNIAIKSPTEDILTDPEYAVRINREAEAWTELGLHPNIAYCYFVRHIEGVPHLFVEYVDGGNLIDWIADRRCADLKTGLGFAIQFCHGMAHAHGKGMIHRDIKPDNILLTQDGTLKITDFGIVRMKAQKKLPAPRAAVPPDVLMGPLTQPEMGTPDYMAPEQHRDAHAVGPEADIFSFGLCLWEMLCGTRPYNQTYVEDPIPDPKALRSDLPENVADLLRALVAFDAKARQQLGGFEVLVDRFKSLYEGLFHEPSPHSELEQLDLEADGLNNRGASLVELGHPQEALECFQQALENDPTHPQATYNLGLLDWRAGRIADDELLRRVQHCSETPGVSNELVSLLLARVHVEQLKPDAARAVLHSFPGRFEALFENSDLAQVWCLATLQGHTGWVSSVCFSPNGRQALSGSEDNTLRLWELKTHQCLATLSGHTDTVNSVCFSPDGQHVLSGSDDKTLRLWDLKTHQCLATLEGHTVWVNSVCFSPDGQRALSGSVDKTLRLWDLETHQCLATLEGHTGVVQSVCFSPDGQHALSGSNDNTLRLWRLIWDLEFPDPADWDERARPYLQTFLTLHCPVGNDGFSRVGTPSWKDEDFQHLLDELQRRGYGWLRSQGVRRELEAMTAAWQGPPALPGAAA